MSPIEWLQAESILILFADSVPAILKKSPGLSWVIRVMETVSRQGMVHLASNDVFSIHLVFSVLLQVRPQVRKMFNDKRRVEIEKISGIG